MSVNPLQHGSFYFSQSPGSSPSLDHHLFWCVAIHSWCNFNRAVLLIQGLAILSIKHIPRTSMHLLHYIFSLWSLQFSITSVCRHYNLSSVGSNNALNEFQKNLNLCYCWVCCKTVMYHSRHINGVYRLQIICVENFVYASNGIWSNIVLMCPVQNYW